jgi:hypothetical protein
MNRILLAPNTVVPALLVLERESFSITFREGRVKGWKAVRDDEEYTAEDPIQLLGLLKLVEARGWDWNASAAEIKAAIERYRLE